MTDQQTKEGVSKEELYKLVWKEHCFAVELRDRILRGWWYVYIALAGGYILALKDPSQPQVIGLIAIGGLLTTVFFWLFDYRNRDGIGAAKRILEKLEHDLKIQEDGFFSEVSAKNDKSGEPKPLLRLVRHGHVINAAALIACLFFSGWALIFYIC